MLTLYPAKGRNYTTVGEIINDWNAGVYFTQNSSDKEKQLVSRNEAEYQGCNSVEFHFNGKRRKTMIVKFDGGVWS